jgi:hypothetical protein
MNIVSKLPNEIHNKIFYYLSNPEANVIRNGRETFAKDGEEYCDFCLKFVELALKRDKSINNRSHYCFKYYHATFWIDKHYERYDGRFPKFQTTSSLRLLLMHRKDMKEMIGQYHNKYLYNCIKEDVDFEINLPLFNCFFDIKALCGEPSCATYFRGTCELYDDEDWSDFNQD